MPEHDFVCEHCGKRMKQFGSAVAHPCPKNGGDSTELVRLDDPTTTPFDLICDGCEKERPGLEYNAFSIKFARKRAVEDGWECSDKTGDWCPRCVAERKVSA